MSQIGQSGNEFLIFSWFFTNGDFQHGMLIFQWKSSIFRWIFTFLHFRLLFSNYSLNLCFGPIYSQFGPFLGELEPFLALKVPFLGHFYKGLYIRKVRFWDIPGRTRIDVESRHDIIFSFRKKFWWEQCQQI